MKRATKKIEFPNGLRILLEEDRSMRSCAMGIWIACGSGYETPELSGASHFMEHMLFKGTPRRTAQDIAQQMDAIGGAINAYTTKEYTCLYARALTEHVHQAFDILADMVSSPLLAQEDIAVESGIITEEIAMYEDAPEELCMDLFCDAVWPTSPFGRNILGTRAHVAAMDCDKLCRLMQQYYVPQRIVISFCGNFDQADVLALCELYFRDIIGGPPVQAPAAIEYHPAFLLHEKDVEQTQLILGFPGLCATDERKPASNLLCSILGASSSSRLFRRIREELGLVYSIDSFCIPYLPGGLFGIAMGVNEQAQAKALEETMRIIRAFPDSLTQEELDRAKEQSVATMIMGLESSSTRVSHMGKSELLYNRVLDEDALIARTRRVTMDDVRTLAKELLQPQLASLCAVGEPLQEAAYREIIHS